MEKLEPDEARWISLPLEGSCLVLALHNFDSCPISIYASVTERYPNASNHDYALHFDDK